MSRRKRRPKRRARGSVAFGPSTFLLVGAVGLVLYMLKKDPVVVKSEVDWTGKAVADIKDLLGRK